MIKKIIGPDPNVNEICNEFESRALHGFKKYGVTTERTDLDTLQWIQHLKEELMDAVVYIHRIQKDLKESNKKSRLRFFFFSYLAFFIPIIKVYSLSKPFIQDCIYDIFQVNFLIINFDFLSV